MGDKVKSLNDLIAFPKLPIMIGKITNCLILLSYWKGSNKIPRYQLI